MRTYTRAAWDEAQELWRTGDFSDEWKPWRHEAAMAGIVYPPEGTKWDSWEDDPPSDRAMLVRAIRETPALLHRCIPGARSWAEVAVRLIRARDEWRADLVIRERWDDREDAGHIESAASLANVIRRIEDSA